MANNYCSSSSLIPVPESKRDLAEEIIQRVEAELEADACEGYASFTATLEPDGVWIRHDESINPDHAATLVKALVEELDLEGVFVCSWAYTCSKPRTDEFGGGAFAVLKGEETVWVDAASEVERIATEMGER